jgi:hypothetical protein
MFKDNISSEKWVCYPVGITPVDSIFSMGLPNTSIKIYYPKGYTVQLFSSASGSGVATNSDSGSSGGTYKGIIMKTPGGVNFAPLLPNYSPCCGNTPWCNGRCEPIMFRGSDVTDAELINIFGIPSGKVSYVKVAPAVNTEMKIKLQGAVDQDTETSYFKWNTTTGVTNTQGPLQVQGFTGTGFPLTIKGSLSGGAVEIGALS